ncbi:MAG: hypothetical protein WD670_09570 [Actinomycetota bacterium]
MSSAHRRGLINGTIAAVATFAIGSAVVAVASNGNGDGDVTGSPTPSISVSPSPACDPTWEVVPSADPGEAPTTLLGVVAVTASEAWAVGGIGTPDAPTAVAIQHWDGASWSAVEAPSPGTIVNELLSVDASEPNDVWAVGRTSNGSGDDPLVLHFDGTEWAEVAIPEEVDGVFTSVAAIAPTDVWAVGFVGDPAASLERALVLHWDGVAWSTVEVNRAVGGGKAALLDIEWVSPTDLWVVGYHHFQPLILRFDGSAWSRSPTDVRGTTNAIEAFATSEVWTVGDPIQRFDGTTWTAAEIVRPGADLVGVAAVAVADIWAVGSRPAEDVTQLRAAVYRYSGRRWVPVDGPSVAGSEALNAVDALPDGTVFAVGTKDVELERRTLAMVGSSCPLLG